MSDLSLKIPFDFTPKQWRVINFRAPKLPNCLPQIEILGILGEYGGGKTFIAMVRFLLCCLANPFIEGEHSSGDEPMSAIVGPTLGDLKRGALAQFRRVCPEELIYKERLYGEHQDFQLINGHRIVLQSAVGALNGTSLCQIAVDEIQEDCYSVRKWKNYQGRVRDKRATWLNCMASGIADRGHVEDLFRDKPNPTGNRFVTMLFPEDNPHLAEGYVQELIASMPASMERDPDGWLMPHGAMYPTFSSKYNLDVQTRVGELLELPASIGVDFGRQGAVVAGVRVGDALVICHQIITDRLDAEAIAEAIAESPINLVPGVSAICVDPTAESDQLKWIEQYLPGVEIVQQSHGPYFREKTGIRAVDRAVRDAHGVVRLLVHPSLAGDPSKRGVVEMFRAWRSDKPKDRRYEHVGDAVRYLVCHELPLPHVKKSTPIVTGDPKALHRATPLERY